LLTAYRELFQTDLKNHAVNACSRALKEQGPRRIWKDGKDGFEAFLKTLDPAVKAEVVDSGTIGGVNVFKVDT
jgi:hypothetical protein